MKRALRAALVLVVGPAAVAGQEPADTVQLQPVVVTATRVPTPADVVPAAVTVITGAELRARGFETVFEALRALPGVTVVQTGSFGGQTSVFVRGGESNYVKVLVDGVPANQPGGDFDWAHLTTGNVERIEVVRGPVSVLYGSDAVAGVVQIFTRRAPGKTRADVRVRAGRYGAVLWDAEVAGGGRTASYSFSLSRVATDGIYAFNNHYRNAVFSGLVRVAPDDRSDATLSLRYADHAYHFPTDGGGDLVDRNQFTYGSGPTVGVEVGHHLTPRLEARVLLAANETDAGFDDRPDDPSDTTGFYGFQSLDHVRRASADVRANFHVRPGSVLTAGLVFEQESQRGFNASQSQFGSSSGELVVRRSNHAYYAQAVTDLSGQVALTLGARLEDNERFGTFFTYRVGAAYRLPGGTRFRVSAGTGFKEPTFFENYSTGFSVGNPGLRPERSRSWEAGLDQALLGGRVSFSMTYFDQRFRDLIDYTFSPTPPDTANYYNIAGATADGIEFRVQVVPAAGSWVTGTYTDLRTRVTNPGFDPSPGAAFAAGRPLLRRPSGSARLDAGYRVGTRGTASLAVVHVGERADQDYATFPFPRVAVAGYTRVDLAAEVEVLRPHRQAPGFAASARVENLFDLAYQEVKNFPARRRTLLLGGELRFGS